MFSASTILRTFQTSRAAHLIDMALRLDGSGEYVTLPNVMVGGSAVTIQAWVYARNPYLSAQTIVDFSDSTATNVLSLSLGAGGSLVYTVDNRPTVGAVRQTLVSPVAFPAARWTHVAVVHNGTLVTMIWDGVVQVCGVSACMCVLYVCGAGGVVQVCVCVCCTGVVYVCGAGGGGVWCECVFVQCLCFVLVVNGRDG